MTQEILICKPTREVSFIIITLFVLKKAYKLTLCHRRSFVNTK